MVANLDPWSGKMGKTRTFTDLLDKCESPVQTFIILAQLKMLREQNNKRDLNPRAGSVDAGFLILLAMAGLIFYFACSAAGIQIEQYLTRVGL